MRILSQDGKIDLPYENFSLSITQDNCIVAARDVVARPTEILIGTVAKYSSIEKCRKAMEMLHEEYKKFQTTKTGSGFYFAFDYPKVFRFPTDDEIEV